MLGVGDGDETTQGRRRGDSGRRRSGRRRRGPGAAGVERLLLDPDRGRGGILRVEWGGCRWGVGGGVDKGEEWGPTWAGLVGPMASWAAVQQGGGFSFFLYSVFISFL